MSFECIAVFSVYVACIHQVTCAKQSHVILFCSLGERPECHMTIASNESCLHQLTCLALTPSMEVYCKHLVATIFMGIANTPSTHPYLAKPLLITRLLDACDGDEVRNAGPLESMALKYASPVASCHQYGRGGNSLFPG